MSRTVLKSDPPLNKISKLLPAEIIALYMLLEAYLIGAGQNVIIFSLVIITVLTPFYLRTLGGLKSWVQAIVSMVTFPIWVWAIADPAVLGNLHNPTLSSITVILWGAILMILPIGNHPSPATAPTE